MVGPLWAHRRADHRHRGGLLSHSAIVAREHGLPAVVGTGSATSHVRSGQQVTVDGTRGGIEVHG
ncbi:MAG: PEP-utilizing enzyme [Actinomycetota bacterium]